MRIKWEEIYDSCDEKFNHFEQTYRAKVQGGWLVKHVLYFDVTDENLKKNDWQNVRISMCFVPDAQYKWGENIMDGAI